jgi:hypothetical protein
MDMDCTTVASTLIDRTCNQAEISWSDIVCRHVLNSDGFDTRAALLSVNNGLAYLLLLIRFGHPRPWPQAMEGKLRLLGTGAFCCRDATVELRRKKTSPVCSPTVLPLFLFSRGFSTPYPRLRRAASQPTCVRRSDPCRGSRPPTAAPGAGFCSTNFCPQSSPPSMWRSSVPLQERERGGSCRLGNGERD